MTCINDTTVQNTLKAIKLSWMRKENAHTWHRKVKRNTNTKEPEMFQCTKLPW